MKGTGQQTEAADLEHDDPLDQFGKLQNALSKIFVGTIINQLWTDRLAISISLLQTGHHSVGKKKKMKMGHELWQNLP